PIKDVLGVVSSDLVNLADLAAISGNHLPASADHQPRNRISHLDILTARAQQRRVEPGPQLERAIRLTEESACRASNLRATGVTSDGGNSSRGPTNPRGGP